MASCVWILCEREQRALLFFVVTAGLALLLDVLLEATWSSNPSDSGETLRYVVVAPACIALVIYLLGGFQEQFLGV